MSVENVRAELVRREILRESPSGIIRLKRVYRTVREPPAGTPAGTTRFESVPSRYGKRPRGFSDGVSPVRTTPHGETPTEISFSNSRGEILRESPAEIARLESV